MKSICDTCMRRNRCNKSGDENKPTECRAYKVHGNRGKKHPKIQKPESEDKK